MKSTMKFTAQAGAYLAFFLALAAFALPAQAHEFRAFGRYAVQLGSDVEPPQVGVANGIDVFAVYEKHAGQGDYVFLDRTKGDTVELAVIPITVATEANNAPFVGANHGIFTHFVQTIIEGDIGYLASGFTPDANDVGGNGPHSGYLGYYLTAHLKKAGKPDVTLILKKFVCGAGSLDPDTAFECVIP